MLAALYDMTDEFLTVADVATILRLNQQTVRNWIDRGELPSVRVRRRVRIRRSDFERLVERGQIVPAAEHEQAPVQAFWDGELAPTPVEPSGRG